MNTDSQPATGRQQRWAEAALSCVAERKPVAGHGGHSEQTCREYRSLCMKMPTLIKQSGLVQALAFMRSRSDSSSSMSRTFCANLAQVYAGKAKGSTSEAGAKDDDIGLVLLRKAQAADLASYLVMTRDLIEISVWFRRFAQSELPAPPSSSGDL
ncbi:type III-B CRISPR module-associated protein Cmr5 [Haliangium sp. UPWRP_2]|uniref:type III-B CRISPR module-associated protein Cmr5 n=1 Tax=Haliangium sp. UPWRP_2 TaxID=1931276 RepID=UPI000B53CF40|nr:type III-B CRISPR module-associated protein Cmr5 [Haliangium sp. UPWRP_2]PSM32303.1 type III-B CRISPR module-associated protein Cmr5 [Haliangium sp. UPWRP_2]